MQLRRIPGNDVSSFRYNIQRQRSSHNEKTVAMIKRTLEISSEPTHVSVRHGQLQLSRDKQVIVTVPSEDLGVVIVDQPQTTYSHAALTTLMAQDVIVVLCGSNHQPCGMLIPFSNHTQVVHRLRIQVDASLPVRKRMWQQLVVAKINGQANNLEPASPAERRLREFAASVRSGDPNNREAHAAKTYWSNWLSNLEKPDPAKAFRRDPDGDGLNGLLNYGYAILRAALARAIVAAGLSPALGVHHSNRSNAFCLADDLIEPLRPLVDLTVRNLAFSGETSLTPVAKAALLKLLTVEMKVGSFNGPMMVSLHRYIASLVRIYEGQGRELEIPILCNSAVTKVCG